MTGDSDDSATQYIKIFADDALMRKSLLACSAALTLDDETASVVIKLALPKSAQPQVFLGRIKRLGCVSHKWDGSWRISEDVRLSLLNRLAGQLPHNCLTQIRTELAFSAEQKAKSFSPDGQITNYRIREAKFHAAYQKLLMPGRIEEGAELCADIWRQASIDARAATCSAVDYVSAEIQRQAKQLPPELLFLKGMAARNRGDQNAAKDYFHLVWEKGRRGDIFAIAAHLFGNLCESRKTAEVALRDSLQWYDDRSHHAQVYHSLGNLLSRQSNRWKEAEDAFRESLRLDLDASGRAKAWHSLGNLLTRQHARWPEAEESYSKSLQLDNSASGTAQVLHSLGNLLSQGPRRKEAEEAYRKSLRLWQDPFHQGQVLHSLGNLLSRQESRWKEAEANYQMSLQLLDAHSDQAQVWHSLGNLLSRQPKRWKEAEEAYANSLRLRHDPSHEGQVLHSLGNLLSNQGPRWPDAQNAYRKSLRLQHDPLEQVQVYSSWARAILTNRPLAEYEEAEKYAKRALLLGVGDLRTQSMANGILARLYEGQGEYRQAVDAITSAIEADEKLPNRKLARLRKRHLNELRRKL